MCKRFAVYKTSNVFFCIDRQIPKSGTIAVSISLTKLITNIESVIQCIYRLTMISILRLFSPPSA